MEPIPSYLFEALRFQNPRTKALLAATDAEWRAILTSWRCVRLTFPLLACYAQQLPAWVRERIETFRADNSLRFDRIMREYYLANAAFRAAGVEHVVLKGFSLWPGYTDHPRDRPQSDVDLYCPPDSIFGARDALAKLGYAPSYLNDHLPSDHLPPMISPTPWTWRGNFFDPDIPISFELHFRWWNDATTRISIPGLEGFWSRRIERSLDGLLFPALDPVDNLTYTTLSLTRNVLRGSVAAEQLYTLARFLQTFAEDRCFWRRWQTQHEDAVRRLQAISFRLAADWFACRLPEEVEEELERLPAGISAWLDYFSHGIFSPQFDPRKDGLWLHVNLLSSLGDKSSVLFRRLIPIPDGMPKFETAIAADPLQDGGKREIAPSAASQSVRQSVQYCKWILSRGTLHLSRLPVTLFRGVGYWISSRKLGRQFWTFFAAAFCFDLGMTMFFFLYNLYLVDRGYKEDFLGVMTSAMNIGALACTLPAGYLVQRLGLRKSLLSCVILVTAVSAARTLFTARSGLLAFAFLAGFVATIWAVAISPAIAQLTNEKTRPYGFSVVFSSGIGLGVLANLLASRLPGFFIRAGSAFAAGRAKQLALLLACAIVAVGLLPLSRLRFPTVPVTERRLYPRNRFLWRFLPALAVWSLVTGSLSPLSNVYFSQYWRMPLERVGITLSLSHLLQAAAVFAAPFLFRRLGLIPGIVSAQVATAICLGALAAMAGPFQASAVYIVYTGFLWMSQPGLFTLLMDRVAPAEQAGASALNFLVISLAQAVAVAAAGASFSRFGYPVVFRAIAATAAIAALSFWWLLGKEFVGAPAEPARADL